MKIILEKTVLSEKYPYDFFKNREKLVGIFPTHDELVLEFLKATNKIITKTEQESTIKLLQFNWPASVSTDTVTYAVLPFDSVTTWAKVSTSQEFVNFHKITKRLFPLLGWKDCGYKAINVFDYAILQQPNLMNKLAAIWDEN